MSKMPNLMLTARDTLEDKLMGFDVGADDYFLNPLIWKSFCSIKSVDQTNPS